MRTLLLVLVLLCLLIASGCQPAQICSDPLGCARFGKNQPVKIGIVTPRTDARACPQAAEASQAIQIVLAGQTIAGRPVEVIEEDSLNDPVTAQQRMNDLAEDPATIGLFYLDCTQDPGRVALTAVDAGIPGFVHQLPEEIEGVYPILPSVEEQANRLLWLLGEAVDGALLVAVDPLDGPEELSHRVCMRWPEQNGGCTVETFSEDLLVSSTRTDTLLVLSTRVDSLAGLNELPADAQPVYWFDPSFSQRPDARNLSIGANLLSQTDLPTLTPQYLSTWFAARAAALLLEAARAAAYEKYATLFLPRQAALDELDRLIFPDCHPAADPACPESFDYTLYPFRDGILIINP